MILFIYAMSREITLVIQLGASSHVFVTLTGFVRAFLSVRCELTFNY